MKEKNNKCKQNNKKTSNKFESSEELSNKFKVSCKQSEKFKLSIKLSNKKLVNNVTNLNYITKEVINSKQVRNYGTNLN